MVQINSAESNRSSVRVIKEAVWGVTPLSGVTQEVRLTGSGLETSKETKVSEEIRSDRMIPAVIEVGASSSGPISFEFSAGSLDGFLEAFLLSTWSLPMSFFQLKGTSVVITDSNTITLTGADYTAAIFGYVKLEGFLNPTNNGYFAISSSAFSAGNTTIDVVGTPLIAEAGSALTAIYDANDVILASTTTAFTAGNTIDGGGVSAFAGKTLKVGQKIYVEGLGKETSTLTFNASDPLDGSTVTLTDGTNSLVFEFRTDLALTSEGYIGVLRSGTEATQAAALAAAVNLQFAQKNIYVSAAAAAAIVTLKNHKRTGGAVSVSDVAAVTAVAFSGGSATKGGFYTISSLPNDDTIVTVETLTTDANGAGATVIVKGSHVRNPATSAEIVKQSFSIETGFEDISQYFLRNGLRVGSFNLEVKSGDILVGEVEFMGRETIPSTTSKLGNAVNYTVLDTTTTEILNATSNVGSLKVDGAVLEGVAFKSITLEGDAALREQRAIGEKFPAGIGYGRFTLSGSVEAYFSDRTLYDKFIDHETTGISFDVTDADFNTYIFTVPSLKITSDSIVPEAIDQDVMDNAEYTAIRDAALKTQFLVDRFSSVYPSSQV